MTTVQPPKRLIVAQLLCFSKGAAWLKPIEADVS
jgi:hypothetical protein